MSASRTDASSYCLAARGDACDRFFMRHYSAQQWPLHRPFRFGLDDRAIGRMLCFCPSSLPEVVVSEVRYLLFDLGNVLVELNAPALLKELFVHAPHLQEVA